MDSLQDLLKRRNIIISLRNFGSQDLGTGWEVKAVVENPDVFDGLYIRYPLTELSSLEDYFLYLLSLKLVGLREVIPVLLQDAHKVIISKLSDDAEKALSVVGNGDVVKFINGNIQDIFDKEKTSHDVRFVTLDLVARYSTGISRDTFAFLCRDYGYLLIDRFDQFEKTFEQNPDLFESIYPTGHLDEINSFRVEKTLDIWCHILNKGKSSLKDPVEKRVAVLAEDIKALSETATIDNILQVEGTIRKFHLFLQRIQSPMANEFAKFAKAAADLLSKNILERGQSFHYEIPVEEIISRWKKTENWEVRLLSLTHDLKSDEDALTCVSRLSREPEAKHPLFDFVSTNVPTDDFFTMSHQQILSIMASVGTGTMIGILRDQDTLLDYLNLVASAVQLIAEQLNVEGEQLQQDVGMLSALVQLVSNNLEVNNDATRGMCYGASMYTCAFSEKILRILYLLLAKDERYIPINKATFGELLVVSNTHMVDIFGENHVKNLSFFLQRTAPSNVGQNIRNTLAHWANVSTEAMTPFFVAKMLWIFTDILNTVFWYCLKDVIERNESDDQL